MKARTSNTRQGKEEVDDDGEDDDDIFLSLFCYKHNNLKLSKAICITLFKNLSS